MRGDFGGPTCAAGVDLSSPGASRMCWPDPDRPCSADTREEFTEAERAEWEAYAARSMQRTGVVMQAIPRDGWEGELACPACLVGRVQWARARSNRHLHAACTTPHCFSVMS
jgi:hypothetical protein